MTTIKNQTSFLVCSVVIVGLLVEWASKSLISPSTNYLQYYSISIAIRGALLIYSALIVYKVRGSILLWLFMFVNLCAIFLNILYLESSNYYILHDFRQSYFAPAYRALEVLILLWTGRNALLHLSHIIGVIHHRVGFMAARWRIYLKAKKV